MTADTLQSELLAVAGVASAVIDVADGSAPAGVKVSLTPGADAARVGVEVQRVLAAHGMRSRFSPVGEDAPISASPPVPVPQPPPPPTQYLETEVLIPVVDQAPPMAAVPAPPESAPPVRVAVPAVESVSIEERVEGLTATVLLVNGRRATRVVGLGSDEMDEAIIAAVAEVAGVVATRAAVEWLAVEGANVVTVVVQRDDGSLAAGAGVMRVGRAFAVAIATRIALEA